MSDARLYLRCRHCGAELKLASIYFGDDADKLPDRGTIQQWLNEHLDLGPGKCAAWPWEDEAEDARHMGFEVRHGQ